MDFLAMISCRATLSRRLDDQKCGFCRADGKRRMGAEALLRMPPHRSVAALMVIRPGWTSPQRINRADSPGVRKTECPQAGGA